MDTQRCADLKAELDAARVLLAQMRGKSGIRSVQDSDGSRVEYSGTGLAAQQTLVYRLETQLETLCGRCFAAGPYRFVF